MLPNNVWIMFIGTAALFIFGTLACLWHLAGFSNKEIAEQLGTTSEHVEMTLRNATNEVPEASLR